MKKMNFSSRKFRGGAYATILSILVVVLVLGINLLAGLFLKTADLTNSGTYSLSDETLSFLKQIDTPIELYYVSETGEEHLVLSNTAELFAEHCENITISYKDPVQYPQFVYKYNGVSDINNNSIIVINSEEPERYDYIDREEMFIYTLDQNDLTKKKLSGYDAEMELVKSILSVTDSDNKNIYFTTGHGEFLINPNSATPEVSTTLHDLLSINSYTPQFLDLTREDKVPADCDILLIGGATTDFTEAEIASISEYITNGGTVALFLYYTGEPLKQIQSLTKQYGVELHNGLLNEGDPQFTEQGNKNYVLTKYNSKNVEWAFSTGVTLMDNLRDTLQVESLYHTSDKAFLKTDISSQEWTEGDPIGQYSLLTKATETYQGKTGNLYVFSTCFFLADRCISGTVSYSNRDLFLSVAGEVTGSETSLSIPNNLAREEALQMTTKEKNMVFSISVIVPALFLIFGIVVVFRRRA